MKEEPVSQFCSMAIYSIRVSADVYMLVMKALIILNILRLTAVYYK